MNRSIYSNKKTSKISLKNCTPAGWSWYCIKQFF